MLAFLPEVPVIDQSVRDAIQARLNNLTKPPASLGRLEELVLQCGLIRGSADLTFRRAGLVTFAADHGVAAARVSAYPQEVTAQMVLNLARGGAAINVLCRHYGIEHRIVDVGVDYDFAALEKIEHRKIARGTRNFLDEDAITAQEVQQALCAGSEFIGDFDCVGVGEMGIGNTTSSAAILSVLGNVPVSEAVGRGTGLDTDGVNRKIQVVEQALKRRAPDASNPLDVLAKIGGLEIAAMTGFILQAAASRIPVVIDGFVGGAAALVSTRLQPASRGYMIFSHISRERGHRRMLEVLDARPLLDLDMCLGEGTGAAIAIDLIHAAIRLYSEMATFDSASVSRKS